MNSAPSDQARPDASSRSRPLALVLEGDPLLRPALMQALSRAGYDVVVASSAEQAQRLMAQWSFDRVYTDGTLPLALTPTAAAATSGVTVEDQGDGTARIRMDQVLDWPVAVKLLDLLEARARPRALSS